MKKKDLNYIAGLEKAIKKKYGQPPEEFWVGNACLGQATSVCVTPYGSK